MLPFSDWLRLNQQTMEEVPVPQPGSEQPPEVAPMSDGVIKQPDSPQPLGEEKVTPEEEVKGPGEDEVGESRPYTRSLRYYPSVTPPTGGGPNFQYIAQDGLASANAEKQGMKLPQTVSPKPSPGMDEASTRARLKAWKQLSGVKEVKQGSSETAEE